MWKFWIMLFKSSSCTSTRRRTLLTLSRFQVVGYSYEYLHISWPELVKLNKLVAQDTRHTGSLGAVFCQLPL